jgi:uncharacterized protein (DUF885 family)
MGHPMNRAWKVTGCVALAALLVGGFAAYRNVWGKPFTINLLADRQMLITLERNPEFFTDLGLVDGTILDRHSGRLAAVGVAKRDGDYALDERFLRELREFDRSRLAAQERITYDVLLDQYQTALAFRRFDWLSSEGLYPISPMWGTQVGLTRFLESDHIVKNEKTARNYVKRLEAMGGKLDALTAEMQRQAVAGVVLPPSLLEKSLLVIGDIVKAQPAQNSLVTSFVRRMRAAKGLDPGLAEELRSQAATVLATSVYPAYARMSAALVALRPVAAGQAAGVARLPDGAAFYALQLRQETTTDYTPDQVHALGLAEVERITAEMDALLKGQGYAAGTVAERLKALTADPRFHYPNDDAGRQQVLARYRQLLDEVNARMPAYFSKLPAGRLAVERVPASSEQGFSAAYYHPGAMDGSRAGVLHVNLRDVNETPTWSMKTLAYHEGIPGHHLQVTLALELKGLPLVRRQSGYDAYVEGWALYAERLAAEIGMYKDDPLGDLGRLRDEIMRAVRLVVDTGLHARNWTREQAVDYMVGATGLTESEVVTEVERYMGLPGQACAYKVGQLKILELRARARAALGAKFDLREFHAVVLENGALPLTVLERLVDEWIAASRGA